MTHPIPFYVGTQCDASGQGIYALMLDAATGGLFAPRLVAEVERPTWLSRHPHLPVLYAVSEVGNRDARDGRLLAFRIGADGALDPIGAVSARGGGPTHLALDRGGSTLFVANFGGGQVSAVPLLADGGLGDTISQGQHTGSGPHRRQGGPHPHGVTLSPGGRFLLAPDMGNDRVMIHAFDPLAKLLSPAGEATVPAGSGPRLIDFGEGGRFAYLLSELSGELFVFAWDEAAGLLELAQSLPLDPPVTDGVASAAMLVLSADRRHLYVSNRRNDTIQRFTINGGSGRLTGGSGTGSGGQKPWGGALSPDGLWLLVANQASDNVTAFRRDPVSGNLTEAGSASVPTPTSIAF